MSLTKVTYSMIKGAVVNVIDFGADPTGVNDSLAAIQAAITSVGSNATIFLPAGTYKVTGSIDLSGCNGINFAGAGIRATTIVSNADAPVIKIVGSLALVVNSTGVRDMTIRGSGSSNVSAHGISFSWVNSCYLQNLTFFSCRYAMEFTHNFQTAVNDIRVFGSGSDASYIGVYMAATTLAVIDNAINACNVNVQSTTGYGFRIINGQGSKFVNCEAGGAPMIYGWYVGDPPSGTVKCQWIHFSNCLADSTTGETWLFKLGAATSLGQMQLANCWGGNGINGFYFDGVINITATNLLAIGHARCGVVLNNSVQVSITNSQFLLNNEDANVIYGDINIQGGSFNAIHNNLCATYNVVGQKSLIESNTSDSNSISSNSFFSGATIIGANTFVTKNAGFASEGRGSGTITAGTTSVTVTHGLGITPPLDSITVTPMSNTLAATRFWISNATSTTFNINVDAAPAANIIFAYNINNIRLGY